MGQSISLWFQRSDAESVDLYSPAIDVSSVLTVVNFLTCHAVGTGSVVLQAEQSLDPNNPNGWSNVGSSVTVSAVGNGTPTMLGAQTTGTTQAMGPYIRYKATVTATSGGITWSASAVLRGA